ncbi:hypothetical protein ETD86_31815 [Nonomuraea turkmeniaca]|uniref:MFS transporter n=1 Tax=Nonomuraea turkmeniaca TaxID=103838 RepID=A0A5S4F9B3_9ACTN|nr:hypothetical protein [Nonomuraea turkmeniaca]TMR12774.1 hypothetical protein ETD86_31815 [Nonomuraea turkmeniaca]
MGLLIMIGSHGTAWSLFLAMCLLGLVTGAETTIGPYLLGRYFGLRNFAQLQGLTLGLLTLPVAVVPVMAQGAGEKAGTYTGVLVGLTAVSLILTVMAYYLPRYPSSAPITDTAPALD